MREICSVELSFNKRTGNSKGFAFVATPDHVYLELNFTERGSLIKNPLQEEDQTQQELKF